LVKLWALEEKFWVTFWQANRNLEKAITKIGQNTDIRLQFYVGKQDTNFKGQATLKSEPDWQSNGV